MAKYGLLQIDLNQRACLALMGLSDAPERDVIELLRSPQPIEPVTRELLANALAGRSKGVAMTLTRTARVKGVQKFQKRLDRLKVGRLALHEIGKAGYGETAKSLAARLKASEKSIAAHIAFARKVDAWIAEIRAERPDLDHLEDRDLEMAYLYADASGHDPMRTIKGSLPLLTKFIDHWQDQLTGKAELENWLKQRIAEGDKP